MTDRDKPHHPSLLSNFQVCKYIKMEDVEFNKRRMDFNPQKGEQENMILNIKPNSEITELDQNMEFLIEQNTV